MSQKTPIQWCDSTTNPVMGCAGCELYPSPEQILKSIDREMKQAIPDWEEGLARQFFEGVLESAFQELIASIGEPLAGHSNELTTTNIRHLRHQFGDAIAESFGAKAGHVVVATIGSNLSCYAAQLHGNRGRNITRPQRKVNPGYAPTFEQITQFPGRLADAAKYADLSGTMRPEKPWLNGLPRTIFVSDMGDAFSRREDFRFLQNETSVFQTSDGRRHLWLWLTKRPQLMREFAARLGGFPPNVCAMTTVTSAKHLRRIDALRKVDASVKALSLEPLWGSLAPKLDLTGIDWVIVGGESGATANVQAFPLEWAMELRDLCRDQNVAFFLKQLGRNPIDQGRVLKLEHRHGGDWAEWPEGLRVREMPPYFRDYAPASA